MKLTNSTKVTAHRSPSNVAGVKIICILSDEEYHAELKRFGLAEFNGQIIRADAGEA